MAKLRMRTKFLLSMLLISTGLTCTTLLLVRHRVKAHETQEIFADLQNSVHTFQDFQQERERTLTHSAELLADLPRLRALMTTQHEATIQDVSQDLWRLSGSDLLLLADRTGRVVALDTASPSFTREIAQQSLDTFLSSGGTNHWWFGEHHLYEVFLKPIYFGPAVENRTLGFLVIGYEINDAVAAQVSRVAASHVAFYYGDTIVRSTLKPSQQAELAPIPLRSASANPVPEEVQLGSEHFLETSLELAGGDGPRVRITVLKSYDAAVAFLDQLNNLLLGLGLAAVLGGSTLVFFISHTFTRPLGTLVAGVRALEQGDFDYALDPRGGDEVAEVTGAFNRMRTTLQETQRELLDAERLATIGRMASSISHDLRHSLAAIVANAEFLCESRLSPEQREELYQEVRAAVNRMTDLIDSLLEFSRTPDSLRPAYGNVADSVERAVQAIRSHPEFHHVQVSIRQEGNSLGWFDGRKLERVFYNLLLNACEAVPAEAGRIEIELRGIPDALEILVTDNGRGILESVRTRLFEPFVSAGKENGTGLGLTVVQKIIQDHGGDVVVEKTSAEGTIFKLSLPLVATAVYGSQGAGNKLPMPPMAMIKTATKAEGTG
jgi:signal transduction histidine kinase